MSQRVRQVPHAAFVEEYDEDANVVLPETRQVANVAAKRSKSDLRHAELGLDFASDSGYSSRTAATVNSSQSPHSGRRSPVSLKLDTSSKLIGTERLRESRKDKGKGRDDKRASADMMHFDAIRNASRMAPSPRSPSKPRRRDSASIRHTPGTCWECEQGLYHSSTPIEPRPIDFSYYYAQPPPPPPVHDIPSSPKSTRHPYPFVPDVHVSQGAHAQRRMSRSNSYHANGRPLSFHGALPDVMYNPMAISPYGHGPPLSASAYTNMTPFPPYPQQPQYYHDPGPGPQPIYERPRASSRTRPREQPRRGSLYGTPVVEHAPPTPTYDGGAALERRSSREHRTRPQSQSYDLDEDYYRMPPPPPPAPKPKPKSKPPPQIIQPRRSVTTTGGRRPSQSSFDMADLEAALPDRVIRQFSGSRDPLIPERSHSLRNTRRTTSYHDSDRPARIAIEDSRRRRTSYYGEDRRKDLKMDLKSDLEQKHRSAEEYQASRSGKTVPLTADALFKAKVSQRPESDSGSQKSHSNSSRGSDARTRDGSGVGSKFDDDNSITMTMNGLTMSFSQETVGGKRIHVRTGDEGAMQLNIEGRRPRRYIMPAGSDHTSSSGKKENEDVRRTRDEGRSDRASRRSSRSTFSGRGFD
jgi:hypothetical protein